MAARAGVFVRGFLALACPLATAAPAAAQPAPADLLLVNGRVYTLAWGEPSLDGAPAADAPRSAGGYGPDAEAIAIRGGRIVFVGGGAEARAYRGPKTRLMDLGGATVLPGLVDSHTHIVGLGEAQSQVDLVGVASEADAVERVAAFAKGVPKGQWILGRGWDEGAWANHYPTKKLLSERVPDHPTLLSGLHGFAVWANPLALERARISRATSAPEGGEIVKDAAGEPTGVLLNRATSLLTDAVPPPSEDQYEAYVLAGLTRMAHDGYGARPGSATDARPRGRSHPDLCVSLVGQPPAPREGPRRAHARIVARDRQGRRTGRITGHVRHGRHDL